MHESLHRDSGMTERGRAYQDKGLRERWRGQGRRVNEAVS